MTRIHLIIALLFATLSIGSATSTTLDGIFTCESPATGNAVRVSVITPDIIQVTTIPAGMPSTAVKPSALAVLKAGSRFNGEVKQSFNEISITTTTGVDITIEKLTGSVSISAGGQRAIYDNGLRHTAKGRQRMELSTMGRCRFFGAGERGHSLDLAGDTLVMYNRQNYGYTASDPRISQMNITMPLFVSSAGYAVLFDDYAPAEMILGNPVQYITESDEVVSYYFINGGGSMARVMQNYTALTGRQPLAPLWALGYITSKYGYHDRNETVGAIDTLHREGYPVDGIVLDLYWYGKEQDMGALSWEPTQWPDHEKMLADLKAKGVNTVAISQPYVLRNGRGLQNYNELAPKGLFVRDSLGRPHDVTIWVGEGGMWDMSNPDTRQWLSNRYRQLTDGGVSGWWGDLGEPEVHPETMMHYNGKSARQYHNLYGNDWSSVIADLFKKEYPDRRLMTMMRGGTAGLQRYSVFPWSTDVSRSWGGLQPQINIMLNSGMSGLGYMSHDVGGFAIDQDRPFDPELYTRWLQLGLFSPVLRTHSQQTAEPYHYGELQPLLRSIIKDRYRWLPYNYTLAYENTAYGWPLVRPMSFYGGNTESSDTLADQYLWGKDVLVAPVLWPGATSRRILFPDDGSEWVDMHNPDRIYTSADTICNYPAPLDMIPLFVRRGSFITTADYPVQNTGDYDGHAYTIHYTPAEQTTTGYVFEDNGRDPSSISSRNYAKLMFSGREHADGSISIEFARDGSYHGMKTDKDITLVISNVKARPRKVSMLAGGNMSTLKGRSVSYDASKHQLTVSFRWDTRRTVIIRTIN